jgi:4-hydroxybenzoate polyprenyltransferase
MAQDQHISISDKYKPQHQLAEQVLGAVVYSSVFISCCAFSLTIETYKLAGLPISMPMAAFVFLATLFTYNLSSVYSFIRRPYQKQYKYGTAWWERNKKLLAIVGAMSITAAAGVYFYFGLEVNTWILLHLAIISVGYTVPVIYKANRVRPLRSIPLLKVFLIAYVWAVVTAWFPLLDAGIAAWDAQAVLLLLRRFLFILALALLFDIRDYAYDRSMKTLTIPGLIGVRNTKLLSLSLLGIYTLLAIQSEVDEVQWALVASAAMAALVVLFANEHKPRIYYALLADGAMLLHAGMVYLAFS